MTRALPAMRTIERAGLPPIVKKLKRIPNDAMRTPRIRPADLRDSTSQATAICAAPMIRKM